MKNIKIKKRKWELPKLSEAKMKAKNNFNICENEYYSCC